MIIKSTIVAFSMLLSSIPFGISFDTTATQTITGTLSANLAIAVSTTGNSNVGEDGSYDCTSNFFPSSGTGSFARGQIADSQCTYLTFTASSSAWEILVENDDDVECGFMFDDDGTDGWDNDGTDKLLTDNDHTGDSTVCDAVADQADINASGTGSSLFMFAEGFDQSEVSGSTGDDCNSIGVTTSAGTDTTENVVTLGTPNPLSSNAAFGEGLVVDGTGTELLKCTAPVSSGAMFVDIRVVVPNLALDGTYVMDVTYTIQNTP